MVNRYTCSSFNNLFHNFDTEVANKEIMLFVIFTTLIQIIISGINYIYIATRDLYNYILCFYAE